MFSIETERLRLRRFEPDDLNDYFVLIHSDPDVMRYITGFALPIERTEQTLQKFISHHDRHGYSVWAVTTRHDGRLIGHGGLITLPNGVDVEVDYALGKTYWGMGYATEIARAVMRYGFEACGLEEIYALAFPENLPSQRVMQKLGMTYRGRSRQFYDLKLEVYTLRSGELRTDKMAYSLTR